MSKRKTGIIKKLGLLSAVVSLVLPAAAMQAPVYADENTGTQDTERTPIIDTDQHSELVQQLDPIKADTSAVDAKSEAAASAIIEAAKGLPSKVDLRNYNGKNYVTPVKYQAPYASCWAFSIAGAAEISYLFANDLGVPAGQENNNANFSEKHINWYMYNRIRPDDVNETDIEASQIGEGFNTTIAQKYDTNAVYNFGGNMGYGSNLLASGMGPVKESYVVNGTTPFTYSGNNGWRDNDRNESSEEAAARKAYYYDYYKVKSHDLVADGEIEYQYQFYDWYHANWKPGNKYYEKSFEGSNYSIYDDWSLPSGYAYRIPGVGAFFKSSNVLPTPALGDENGNYSYNEEGVAAIKLELAKGNGVSIAYFADESKPGQKTGDDGFMNTTTWAQYYTGVAMANHAVTVVGYDDNYPKENFKRTAKGRESERSIPPADGAFIVKNSWGALTQEDKDTATYDQSGNPIYSNPNARAWGIDDTGYFYLSYYDNSIVMAESFEFFTEDEIEYKTIDYAQHDLFQGIAYRENDSDTKVSTANVFDVIRDGSLYQISYMATVPGTTVHYDVYRDVKAGDPTSGTLLESGDSTYMVGGYHRITLKDKYPFKKGEKYSVVITQTHDTDEGTKKYSEVYSAIVNGYSTKDVTVKTVINKGESYIYQDGKWKDLSDLKAQKEQALYNDETKDDTEEEIAETFLNGLKDFGIDNYPIKAFLIPDEGASDPTVPTVPTEPSQEPTQSSDPTQPSQEPTDPAQEDPTDPADPTDTPAKPTEEDIPGSLKFYLTVSKNLDGNDIQGFDRDMTKNQFAFRIYDNDGNDENGGYRNILLPRDTSDKDDPDTTFIEGPGRIVIPMVYTEPGIHNIRMREIIPSENLKDEEGRPMPENSPGMEYDSNELAAKIEITEEDGELKLNIDGIDLSAGAYYYIGQFDNISGTPKVTSSVTKLNGQTEEVQYTQGEEYTVTNEVEFEKLGDGADYTVESLLFKDYEPFDKVVSEVSADDPRINVTFTRKAVEPEVYRVVTILKQGDETIAVYNGNFEMWNDVDLKAPREIPPEDPTVPPTEPTEEPTEPTEEPTEPSEDPTGPSEDPTQPKDDPTEPAGESTDPSESDKPAESSGQRDKTDPVKPSGSDNPTGGSQGGNASGSSGKTPASGKKTYGSPASGDLSNMMPLVITVAACCGGIVITAVLLRKRS